MQFTTAFIAVSAATLAAALPQTTPVDVSAPFGVVAVNSGTPIQNAGVQAAQSSLYLGHSQQNASCDTPTNTATFHIVDEELLLYAASATPQKVFVDRSGMGMGVVGYVTGAQPLVRNGETKGWSVDANNRLNFDGTGLQACPTTDGYAVWLQGVQNPGNQEGCIAFDNFIVPIANPDSCLYTQYQG